MASDWAEEKLGFCEMRGCEDPELRQPLLWLKTNSGGKYRCEKCRCIAASAKEWTQWASQRPSFSSQASMPPPTMRIFVKTLSGKTIATDVAENDVIDMAEFAYMDRVHLQERGRDRSRSPRNKSSHSRARR